MALVVSALALVTSFIFGLRNRSTAKKALQLSEAQEARRQPMLDLTVDEALAWRASPTVRLLGCHILVANPTDRSSSLVSVELQVSYTTEGVVTTVKIPTPSSASELPNGVRTSGLPIRLDPNSAVVGWFSFVVPDGLSGGHPIDRYDIAIRDVHDVIESWQTIFHEVAE